MTRRARHFRVVAMRLECGCVHYALTSYYRVSERIAAEAWNHATRQGVWCCGGQCQPVELLGTARSDGSHPRALPAGLT